MSENRRTQILDAAIRLLEREGPAAFKQTRVAAEAHVEQGHLTYYFPKKSDLLLGVFERFSEQSRAELLRSAAGASEGDRKDALFRFARVLAHDRRRTRLVLALFLEAQGDGELEAKIAEVVHRQRLAICALLGREPGDPDAELALATLRGIGVENVMVGGESHHVDALVDHLARWLDAREAPQGRKRR